MLLQLPSPMDQECRFLRSRGTVRIAREADESVHRRSRTPRLTLCAAHAMRLRQAAGLRSGVWQWQGFVSFHEKAVAATTSHAASASVRLGTLKCRADDVR